MNRIEAELNALLKDAATEAERNGIVVRYFTEKAALFKNGLRALSDDELDNVVGGKEIGDVYGKCDDYRSQCVAKAYSINTDICSLFAC